MFQKILSYKPTKALHNLNICHRHLCPEAILISGTGHCKISRLHRATLMNPPCKMTEDVGVSCCLTQREHFPPEDLKSNDDGTLWTPLSEEDFYTTCVNMAT